MQVVKMKVTASTLPRRSASASRPPSGGGQRERGRRPTTVRSRAYRPAMRPCGRRHRQSSQQQRDAQARAACQRLQLPLQLVEKAPVGALGDSFLGVDLMIPPSRRRKRVKAHRVLGVVLAPLAVADSCTVCST